MAAKRLLVRAVMLGLTALGALVLSSTAGSGAPASPAPSSQRVDIDAVSPEHLNLESSEFDEWAKLSANRREALDTSEFAATLASVTTNNEAANTLDAASVARNVGVSHQEMERRIAIMDELGPIVADFERIHAADRSGFYFQHEPDFATVVRLTATSRLSAGDVIEFFSLQPSAFSLQAAGADALSTLRIERGGIALEDQATMIEALTAAFKSRGHEIVGSADEINGGLVIYAQDVMAAEADLDPILTSVAEGEGWEMDRETIRITSLLTDDGPGAGVHGGTRLTFGGDDGCTSSFTVVRNGVDGVLTAGHCPNVSMSTTFRTCCSATPFNRSLAFSAGSQLYRENWDVQVQNYEAQDFAFAWFTYDLNSSSQQMQRGVHSRRPRSQQQIGNAFCAFGYTNLRGCGTITSRTICPMVGDWVPDCSATFMQGSIFHGSSGSSGGPVYSGSVALGVISGKVGNKIVWMAQNFANDRIDSLPVCSPGPFCPS